MDDDFPVELLKSKDDSEYQRDGNLLKLRTYTFFMGKHGPFVEKVPLENFDEFEIGRRIDKLRAHLRALPR